MVSRVIDLSGLKCPLPVLRTRKALKPLRIGESLTIIATDPMAAIDLPHFCRTEGHRLIGQESREEALAFVIEKGAGG